MIRPGVLGRYVFVLLYYCMIWLPCGILLHYCMEMYCGRDALSTHSTAWKGRRYINIWRERVRERERNTEIRCRCRSEGGFSPTRVFHPCARWGVSWSKILGYCCSATLDGTAPNTFFAFHDGTSKQRSGCDIVPPSGFKLWSVSISFHKKSQTYLNITKHINTSWNIPYAFDGFLK